MDVFKNLIMKYEVSNCRNQSLLNTLVDGSRENYIVIIQIWEMNISTFSGFETNMSNMFQVLKRLRTTLVNNQQIIVKQNMVQ
jgi:hypothetical protein